jgi:hypothetical protein
MIERAHRQLKDTLQARVVGSDWSHHLSWVLLGLRAAPKENFFISSAELVFISVLALLGLFMDTPELPTEIFLVQQTSSSASVLHPAHGGSLTLDQLHVSGNGRGTGSPSRAPVIQFF